MSKKLTREEVVKRARAIHGDKYDYSKVVYINMHTKVCIICPDHGEFWMTPNNHLFQKQGCGVCGDLKSGKTLSNNCKAKRPDLSHVETPPGSRAVPVGKKGDYALVDEEDYERVMEYNWYLTTGYAINDAVGMMHRFIMNPPDDMEVDHIFHNKLDNRKGYLRISTPQQNVFNSRPYGKASKYKGVYWSKAANKWYSQMVVDGKCNYIGLFESEVQAAKEYDKLAIKLQGKFAYLNFPEECSIATGKKYSEVH